MTKSNSFEFYQSNNRKSVLNHVALHVPNTLKASEYLKPFGFKIGLAEK